MFINVPHFKGDIASIVEFSQYSDYDQQNCLIRSEYLVERGEGGGYKRGGDWSHFQKLQQLDLDTDRTRSIDAMYFQLMRRCSGLL